MQSRVIMRPKGDLNDWLCHNAQGHPEAFKKLLNAAMKKSLTPWTLEIERLPMVPRRLISVS